MGATPMSIFKFTVNLDSLLPSISAITTYVLVLVIALLIYYIFISFKKNWEKINHLTAKLTVEQTKLSMFRNLDVLVSLKAHIKEFSENFWVSTLSQNITIVEKIVYMIAIAGDKESRIDVQELTSLANDIFEREIDSIRAAISSLIVMGLLGTLCGLAGSFIELSIILASKGRIDNPTIFTRLLVNLVIAFFPSITGVLLTILGLKQNNSFISKHVDPFLASLKETIISLWIPELYPTSPQKWAEILETSSKELKHALEEIKQSSMDSYKEFSEHVKDTTKNVKELNKIMSSTIRSSSLFNKMIEKMEETTRELSNTSLDLKGRYEDLSRYSRNFNETFNSISETWNTQVSLFQEQYSQIQDLIRKEEETLNKFINAIKDNFDETNKLLEEINKKTPEQLNKIKEEISRLGDPLKKSSVEIDKTFNNFIDFIEKDFHPFIKNLLERVNIKSEISDIKYLIENSFKNTGSFIESIKQTISSESSKEDIKKIGEQIQKTFTDISTYKEDILKAIDMINSKQKIIDLQMTIEKNMKEIIAAANSNGINEIVKVSKNINKTLDSLIIKFEDLSKRNESFTFTSWFNKLIGKR